jgi:hypothetical protein
MKGVDHVDPKFAVASPKDVVPAANTAQNQNVCMDGEVSGQSSAQGPLSLTPHEMPGK